MNRIKTGAHMIVIFIYSAVILDATNSPIVILSIYKIMLMMLKNLHGLVSLEKYASASALIQLHISPV